MLEYVGYVLIVLKKKQQDFEYHVYDTPSDDKDAGPNLRNVEYYTQVHLNSGS